MPCDKKDDSQEFKGLLYSLDFLKEEITLLKFLNRNTNRLENVFVQTSDAGHKVTDYICSSTEERRSVLKYSIGDGLIQEYCY